MFKQFIQFIPFIGLICFIGLIVYGVGTSLSEFNSHNLPEQFIAK